MNIKAFKLELFLIFLLSVISSFDIFLKLNISNFSIRSFYFIEVILVLLAIERIYRTNIKINVQGFLFIYLWALFLVVSIPNTTFVMRNVGYAFWLFLSIGIIVIFSIILNRKFVFLQAFHLYIISFVLIATFGVLQFFLGLFGIDILITQWWIPNTMPRINGFSYEPSYFATYLLIGWEILFFLLFFSTKSLKKYKYYFLILTVAIILSSSRMAILIMGISAISTIVYSILKDTLSGYIKKANFIYLVFGSLLLISLISFVVIDWEKVNFLFQGLGIGGTSSHSSTPRIERMMDTFKIFMESPIVGYSLGGIPSAIGTMHGVDVSTQSVAKTFEGMNIFVEVLAASGIIGFIFFSTYILLLFVNSIKVSSLLKYSDLNLSLIIKALAFAFFWELVILSMNQNILRPYLWVLIGMLNAGIVVGRKVYRENCN